jgi:hypothetical protein
VNVTLPVRDDKSNNLARPQGVVLYRGASLLTGDRIVAVATNLVRSSRNPKTGWMAQTYILADNTDPIRAARSGADEAICGGCPHRGTDGKLGSCYVNLIQGPLGVWRAVKSGTYPRFNRTKHLRLFRNRLVRLGTYGDPAAVPLNVWETILSAAAGWTGYTHQWRKCDPGFARFCMASVETATQAEKAKQLGYRTYRVRLEGDPLLPGEFQCPASAEEDYRLTCEECLACNGRKSSPHAASPSVIVHGSGRVPWKQTVYAQTVTRLLEEERTGRLSLPVL